MLCVTKDLIMPVGQSNIKSCALFGSSMNQVALRKYGSFIDAYRQPGRRDLLRAPEAAPRQIRYSRAFGRGRMRYLDRLTAETLAGRGVYRDLSYRENSLYE